YRGTRRTASGGAASEIVARIGNRVSRKCAPNCASEVTASSAFANRGHSARQQNTLDDRYHHGPGMPGFPVSLQSACKCAGPVLEDPPAQQECVLFQLDSTPGDKG